MAYNLWHNLELSCQPLSHLAKDSDCLLCQSACQETIKCAIIFCMALQYLCCSYESQCYRELLSGQTLAWCWWQSFGLLPDLWPTQILVSSCCQIMSCTTGNQWCLSCKADSLLQKGSCSKPSSLMSSRCHDCHENSRQAVHDARQIILSQHTMKRVSSASDVLLKNSLASLPANLRQQHWRFLFVLWSSN